MWVPLVVVAVVALVVAGIVDVRARRRGARIRGIDRAAALDERRRNEADYGMRTNRSPFGNWGSGF